MTPFRPAHLPHSRPGPPLTRKMVDDALRNILAPEPFVPILSQAQVREARALGIPETAFRVYKPPTGASRP